MTGSPLGVPWVLIGIQKEKEKGVDRGRGTGAGVGVGMIMGFGVGYLAIHYQVKIRHSPKKNQKTQLSSMLL